MPYRSYYQKNYAISIKKQIINGLVNNIRYFLRVFNTIYGPGQPKEYLLSKITNQVRI